MKTKFLPLVNWPVYFVFGSIFFSLYSCGSYQNSSYYDNDGVYGNSTEAKKTQPENSNSENSQKYKEYFSSLNQNDEVFTDVENYSTTRDTVATRETQEYSSGNYSSWGSNAQSVTINVYDNSWGWNYWNNYWYGNYWGWNNWYGPSWGFGWNNWYGPSYYWGWNWGWYSPYYYNNWGWNNYYGYAWNNGYYNHGTRGGRSDYYGNRLGNRNSVRGNDIRINSFNNPRSNFGGRNSYEQPSRSNISNPTRGNYTTPPRGNTTTTPVRNYNNTSNSSSTQPRPNVSQPRPSSSSSSNSTTPTRSYSGTRSSSYSSGSYSSGSSGGGSYGGGRSSGGGRR